MEQDSELEADPDVEEYKSSLTKEESLAAKKFSSRLRLLLAEPMRDVPEVLYHYTDANGLRSILEHGVIWATHRDYMNDPAEGQRGQAIIRDALRSANTDIAKEALQMLGGEVHESAYIASFSERGGKGKEDLPQWLAYGDGGAGFAIGFDLRKVEGMQLRKVSYDEDEFTRQVHELVLKAGDAWQQVLEEARLKPTSVSNWSAGWALVSITDWACCLKSTHWEHEAEWRLIDPYWGIEFGQGLKVRTRGPQLVPYREFKLWERGEGVPIEEIVLGPLQDRKYGPRAVEALWSSLNLMHHRQDQEAAQQLTPDIWISQLEYQKAR